MAVGERADDVDDPIEVFIDEAGERRWLRVVDDGSDATVFHALTFEGVDNSDFVRRKCAADVTFEMAAIVDAFPSGVEFRWLKSHDPQRYVAEPCVDASRRTLGVAGEDRGKYIQVEAAKLRGEREEASLIGNPDF